MSSSDNEDELVTPFSLPGNDTEGQHDQSHEFQSNSDDDIPFAQLNYRTKPTPQTSFPTQIPLFEPLWMPPGSANRIGGRNLHSLRSKQRTPLAIFSLFIPKAMFDTIATNTNKYAAFKGAGDGRPWTNTTASELQCFSGLCLYMGVYPCPRIEDYLDRSFAGPFHRITKCMPLKRFQQLKRFLHVSDEERDNSAQWFFNKVQPMLDHFVQTSQKLWVPGTNVSADEMMVMCYGRSSETDRMRNKPIGSGYKIWALCDRGYIFNCFPHSNKKPWKYCMDFKRKLNHASSVVGQLVRSLPRNDVQNRSLEQKIYCVFMHNLFSTPALFKYLREINMAAVGTVRSNASGFPKCLAIRRPKNSKLPWNTLRAMLCAEGKVLALTWIDNGAVQMLTTKHEVGGGHTIERLRKRSRLTSTNGAIIREVFKENPIAILPIPTVVDDYNLFMGGVDIADQLRSVYTSHLPSRRTWLPLFYWLLDSMAANAYLILASLDEKWANRKSFIHELDWRLVEISETRMLNRGRSGNLEQGAPIGAPAAGRLLSTNVYITNEKANQHFSFSPSTNHYPVKVGDDDRRACIYCRIRSKREAKSTKKKQKASFKCFECGHFLCIDRGRNCFMQFHKEAFKTYSNANDEL